MEKLPIAIHELKPVEATFVLEGLEKPLTLCRWSLRIRAWANAKYTPKGLEKMFLEQDIEKIADMAWFMLKEKEVFNNEMDKFLDAISSVRDQVNLIKAMLLTLGIGEPEIKQISEKFPEEKSIDADMKKADASGPKPKSTKRKTGHKPSTP